MKFNPLLLSIVLFTLFNSNPVNSFGQAHIHTTHHDHEKCGVESMTDRLINENPSYAKELKEFKENIIPAFASQQQSLAAAPIIYVPIVVHIIHNGENIGVGANLSEERILAQIDILNQDFLAMNANYNNTPAQWQGAIGSADIQFCMAITDPNGDPTNGITRHNIAVTGTNINNSNIESEIKPATWWDSNNYYNIYVVGIPGTTAGGGTTGYAYLPTNGMIGSNLDGSVVDYRWFGGPGFGQSGYGTLTHETGHYLGLPHPFDGDDCGLDDGIVDTPNMAGPTSDFNPGLNCSPTNFPAGPVTCTEEHMYVNFMDYVNDDDCSTSFSLDQIAVMRAVLNGTPAPDPFVYGSRLNLANNATTVCSFFDNDAGIASVANPGTNICGDGIVTPLVTLQNYGSSNLTTVTISYTINGGTPVDFIWIDNLGTGETQEVSLAPYMPPVGDYTFTVYTSLPNGVADEQTSNDQQLVDVSVVIPTNLPLSEDFEDAQWDPTANGIFQFNIDNDIFAWERIQGLSAYGNGSAAALFNNYDSNGGANPGGTSDALITSVYDFSAVTGASLSFDVAYAPYNDSFFDSLKVYASTNCGSTFNELLFSDGNTGLATANATTVQFTPSANQWTTHTIDLSAYDNVPNLTIAFINQSGYGNRLFLDNIGISLSCSMTISVDGTDEICANLCDGEATVSIMDGTAPFSYQWDAAANNATSATVNNLCVGNYSVTVTDNVGCTAEATVTIGGPDALVLNTTSTNETAVNANDGTATAIASGGIMPYLYNWNDPSFQMTATAINLAPGNYCVTVTDANNCTNESCISVDPFQCGGFSADATGTDVNCNGQGDGSATANGENGTEPYTYLWSTGAMEATISGLLPDTYTVTVTDANNCSATTSVTISEPDVLSVTINITNETSAGANDGTAMAAVSGGIGAYTYLWSPGFGDTQTIENLSPGQYCVTVTDVNACTATSCNIVDDVDCSSFSLSLTEIDISCFGYEDGSINAIVENGTGTITYDWSNGASGTSIDNLGQGTYTLSVIDELGCSATASTQIDQPAELTIDMTATNPSANGANDGAAGTIVSGGLGPYTYLWSNGQTTQNITGLEAGNYNVTVTDVNNCSTTAGVLLTDPSIDCSGIGIQIIEEQVSCNGGTDGSCEVFVNGGLEPYTFTWSNGQTSATAINLIAGTYTVTITDANDCILTQSVTIEEPVILNLGFTTTDPSSPGASDGSVMANVDGGTPGYSYLWNTVPAQATQMVTNLPAGSYSVQITDNNGCQITETATLLDPSLDCNDFTIEMDTAEITCNGFENGALVASGVGGTLPISYNWSNGTMEAVNNGLGAGIYTVTATDSEGCIAETTVTLTEPSAITLMTNITDVSGIGAMDGAASVDANGGTPPYSYEWSTGAMTAMINNLASGTYTVTVTDANNCLVTTMVVVGIQGVDCSTFILNDFETTNVSCFGESDGVATALPMGGTEPLSYEWSNGGMTQAITDLPATLYVVTITDADGCIVINEVEITQPDSDIIVIFTTMAETSAGAADGSIDITVMGGTPDYTYDWSNGEMTEDIDGLEAGDYILEITDANGCVDMVTIIVPGEGVDCNDFVLESDFNNISCFGEMDGVIVTTASGGVLPITYEWNTSATTQSIINLEAGIYTITATDGNGCQVTEMFEITEPAPVSLNLLASDETAMGANDGAAVAIASGGTGNFTYEWSNDETTSSINNLEPGTYSVTVTDDSGCTAEAEIEVAPFMTQCDDFDATIESTDIDCAGANNGTATAMGIGGQAPYEYEWSNSAGTAGISNLIAGNYTVTVSDFNGCEVVLSTTVFSPTLLEVNVQGFGGNCGSGGTAQATVSGGTQPVTYDWSNGGDQSAITNLENGIYTVTVTDANGCTTIGETQIQNTDGGVEAEAEVIDVSCFGENDGAIDVTPFGFPPYDFDWSNGAISEDLDSLEAGAYTLIITDAQNCTYFTTYFVASPAELNINIDWTPAGNNSEGTAFANVSGGTTPYTYQWNNGEVSSFIDNLPSGSYLVTVTDANACTAEAEVFIGVTSVDDLPGLENLSIAPNPSNGHFMLNAEFIQSKDGTVEVYNLLGQQVYGYAFSTNELRTAIDLRQQAAGSYFLVIRTNEGKLTRKLILQK